MRVSITINAVQCLLEIEPGEILLDILRREGYVEVKGDCRTGDCGACTVLFDGKPIASCMMLAAKADGHAVTTVRGIGDQRNPHALQRAFVHNGAIQCGYCIPGAITSAKALLDENPEPTREDICLAMDSNYCRCTGYEQQIEAVLEAARELREGGSR